MNDKEKQIRLVKYLRDCGLDSRRNCAEIIQRGRVSVDGKAVDDPGFRLVSGQKVTVDGNELGPEEKVSLMLNKPRGYHCTLSDPHADKRAVDLLGHTGKRLFNVGRLDKESEGLLIFTNDGEYAHRLMHPRYRIPKSYLVRTEKELAKKALEKISAGIEDDGEFLKPQLIKKTGLCEYSVVLNEGRKREIRRLFGRFGCRVKMLKRVAVGGLELGRLKPGTWRKLNSEDIAASLRPLAQDIRDLRN